MNTKGTIVAVLTSILGFGGSAQAGSLICSGTVAQVAYHQPGLVLLRLSSMNTPIVICSTDRDFDVPGALASSTTPAACKTIQANLLAAKATEAIITSLYF